MKLLKKKPVENRADPEMETLAYIYAWMNIVAPQDVYVGVPEETLTESLTKWLDHAAIDVGFSTISKEYTFRVNDNLIATCHYNLFTTPLSETKNTLPEFYYLTHIFRNIADVGNATEFLIRRLAIEARQGPFILSAGSVLSEAARRLQTCQNVFTGMMSGSWRYANLSVQCSGVLPVDEEFNPLNRRACKILESRVGYVERVKDNDDYMSFVPFQESHAYGFIPCALTTTYVTNMSDRRHRNLSFNDI